MYTPRRRVGEIVAPFILDPQLQIYVSGQPQAPVAPVGFQLLVFQTTA